MKKILQTNPVKLLHMLLLFGLLYLLILPQQLYAADERTLTSSTPTAGTSFWVYDGKYAEMLSGPTTWQTAFTTKKVTNIVRLAPVAGLSANFEVKVNVTVEIKKWNPALMGFESAITTTDLQVKSSTSTDSTLLVNDKQALVLQGGQAVKVTVNSVTFLSGSTAFSNLVLTSEIIADRQYFITNTAVSGLGHFPSGGAVTAASELEFSWDYKPGAEWYELEYVHISRLGANGALLFPADLSYNYYLNSTRVEVKGNHYTIPKVYDRGYVIYRVRAIGFNGTSAGSRFESDWTALESGSLTWHPTANLILIENDYDPQMNWSFSATFAEDGKRSDAIQYADGMSRGRQTVVSNPATRQVLVNNTYYDEMGRPAVSDLPTPTDQRTFSHRPDFNQANDGLNTSFQYAVFDSSATGCAIVPYAFSTNSGAGKYYSANNPDKDGANAGIPDAEGFPYVRITYKDDLLSRVDKEGAAGNTLKANGGKETRYIDLTSSQLELNRLFGSDIGWANQYRKSAVIDQNGQAMVSYTDLAGRTVATYLTGPTPASLDGLTENVETPVVTPLITNGSGDSENLSEPSSSLSFTQLITKTGFYTFNYNFTPDEFSQVCGANSICLDCVYDFKLTVTDECGEVYLDTTSQVNGAVLDTQCNSNDFALNMLSCFLPGEKAGRTGVTYTFTKHLSVNHDAIDAYWCDYLEASCMDEIPDIFNELYSGASFSNCENSVTNDPGNGPCAIYKKIMLEDVSPGGQYAAFTQNGNVITSTSDPLSLLNTATAGTKYNAVTYLDQLGVPITVENNAGATVSPASLSLAEFVEKFQPAWALSLLPLHPEYCYYQKCMVSNSAGSTAYDQAMLNTHSFNDALDAGYFNPVPATGAIPTMNTAIYAGAVTGADPFFAGNSIARDSMRALMSHYTTIGTQHYSMWDYAIVLGMPCHETDPRFCARNAVKTDNCSLDYIWASFRRLYLQAKQSMMQLYPPVPACATNCNIGVSGTHASKLRRWPCWDELNAAYADPTNPLIDYTAEMEDWCDTSCAAYADQWLLKLAGCNIVSEAALREDLIDLCKSGCSNGMPSGFASDVNGNTINTVLAAHGIAESDLCSELLISEPGLYRTPEQLQDEIAAPLDFCGCETVLQAREDLAAYLATNPFPILYSTVEEMLAHTSGITVDEVDPLLCACDAVKSKFGSSWTETNPIIQGSLDFYQYTIPPALTCNKQGCADCAEISAAVATLKDRFSAIDLEASPNYAVLVTNYLNRTFGKELTYPDYATFFQLCTAASDAPSCSQNPATKQLLDLLTLLAYRGQLTSTAPIDLQTNNAVYELGTIRNQLPAPGLADYYYTAAGNNVRLNFNHGGDKCFFTIDNTAGIDFNSVLSFDLITNTSPACGIDPVYQVVLTYLNCGQTQTATLPIQSSCFQLYNCICDTSGITLCDIPETVPTELCYTQGLNELYLTARNTYQTALEAAYQAFSSEYLATCAGAFQTENLSYAGFSNDYQFTLFYYDQAGNLVRTVAPEGVNLLAANQSAAVDYAREHAYDAVPAPRLVPAQTFQTKYVYNSYNQPENAANPDQNGLTNYFYDYYGRMVASQNPEQTAIGQYSYVLYDAQGRPVESGQMNRTVPSGPGGAGYTLQALSENSHLKRDDLGAAFKSWIYLGLRSEVTVTTYDKALSTPIAGKFKSGAQQNLRLRVATVAYFETVPIPLPVGYFSTGYTSAVHYSYDIHGNVIEQLQDVPELFPVKQDVKSTQYAFELISGNVKQVTYQAGEHDQFIHRYTYDAINRLTETHTSPDASTYSREAHYLYYDYGPLARKELGQEKVQAEDFAYTINGWLKLKNGTLLNSLYDAGKDGRRGYEAGNTSAHLNIPADVTAYTLGYFEGDYKAVSGQAFETATTGSAFSNSAANLYNGNIRFTTTAIRNVQTGEGSAKQVIGASYRYDQLNRLKSMTAYFNTGLDNGTAANWNAATTSNAYSSTYTYDRNGNLKTLKRYANSAVNVVDQLTYHYSVNRNRLHKVTDAAGVAAFDDISNNQSDSNYVYDRLGQLTKDVSEGISEMIWRKGDKKLRSMIRNNHLTAFLYDPFGRRIAKIYRPNGTADKTLWTYTYYANDANGATMAVYDIKYSTNYVYLKEQHLYGAGRLGMVQLNKAIYANAVINPPAITLSTNTLGNKRYELTNHLGNVNAVITDRKAPNPAYSTLAHEFDFTSSGQTSWNGTACSGMSYTLDAGRLKFNPGGACTMTGYKDFAVTSGKPYTISVDIDRSGIANFNVEIYTVGGTTQLITTIVNPANGTITYTLTPTAGQNNVRIYFRKISTENTSFYIDNLRIQTMASPYLAMVIMTSDYYPFGYQMPGRHVDDNKYRYGYNGMEKDAEMHGEGNSYTTEFRQYDPRLGRWLSLDPLMAKYPGMSPYVAFNDNPILFVDPLGLEGGPARNQLPNLGGTTAGEYTAGNLPRRGFIPINFGLFTITIRKGQYSRTTQISKIGLEFKWNYTFERYTKVKDQRTSSDKYKITNWTEGQFQITPHVFNYAPTTVGTATNNGGNTLNQDIATNNINGNTYEVKHVSLKTKRNDHQFGNSIYRFNIGNQSTRHSDWNRRTVFDESGIGPNSVLSGGLIRQKPGIFDGFYDSCDGYKLKIRIVYYSSRNVNRFKLVKKWL